MTDGFRLAPRRIGTILFVGAAFLFLGLALVRQREELLAFEWQVDPVRLAGSVALLVLALACGVAIWARVLRNFDIEVPFPTLARIWFLSSLGRYIPGKVWQFVGVAELSRAAAIPALSGITSLIVYMGFVVLAAGLVGTFLLPTRGLGAVAGALVPLRILALTLLVMSHPRVMNGMLSVLERIVRRPLARWRGSWISGIILVAACVGQWIAFGLAFFLFVSSLAAVTWEQLPALVAAYALAFLAGYLAFIAPAGLGAKEGALTVLLSTALPLPIGVAAALSVAARVWAIAGDTLPALIFLRDPGDRIQESPEPPES